MSYLRWIKVWGLALGALLLLSGIAAGNASAAEWLLNDGSITEAMPTEASGTLELTDAAGGAFGEEVTVKCSGTTTGTAGPGTAGGTTTVTVNECVTVKGTCGSPKASAVNLPWKTELFEGGGVVRDKILANEHGAPGYLVECTVLGITATDTCTSETGQPKVENENSPAPLVFDSESGTFNCSRGGAGQGHVRGAVNFSSPEGALAVGKRWLSVKNVGGEAKEGIKGTCVFEKAGQKCEIQFENISMRTLVVKSTGVLVGEKTGERYEVLKQGCALNLGLGKCVDELKARKIEDGKQGNSYCITVADKANLNEKRQSCANLRM